MAARRTGQENNLTTYVAAAARRRSAELPDRQTMAQTQLTRATVLYSVPRHQQSKTVRDLRNAVADDMGAAQAQTFDLTSTSVAFKIWR